MPDLKFTVAKLVRAQQGLLSSADAEMYGRKTQRKLEELAGRARARTGDHDSAIIYLRKGVSA